jgi:hypothetical protein
VRAENHCPSPLSRLISWTSKAKRRSTQKPQNTQNQRILCELSELCVDRRCLSLSKFTA